MSAQSNVESSIACAVSISGKLDTVLSNQNQILSRLSSLEGKINNLESRIDAINNAIDSLENVLVTSINSIKDVLLAAINGLFELLQRLLGGGGNDTDRILQAIAEARSALGVAIADVGRIVVTQVRQTESVILQAILDCCIQLGNLINQLLRKENPDRTREILDKIDQAVGSIKESIGGSKNEIIKKIEEKCSGDLLTKILAAIAALAALLNKPQCDLEQVIVTINACCNLLEALIRNINCDVEPLRIAINGVSNQVSNVQNTANQINNVTSSIDSRTQEILSVVNNQTNIINQTNNIANQIKSTVDNTYGAITNINNDLRSIDNSVNNTNNSVVNLSNNINNVTNTIDLSTGNILNHVTNEVTRTCGSTVQIVTGTLSTLNCNGNIVNHAYNNIQQMVAILNNNINYVVSQVCQLDTTETELVEIAVPIFTRCNTDREPEFNQVNVFVPKGLEDIELLKFQRIAQIEGKQCSNEAVAVVPEWWQVRVEGGTPQFIMSFGEVDSSSGKPTHAKYAMTIPHFKNIKPEFCPVPTYKKGNYELIAYFKDNAKLIINAFNEQECVRVFNSILPWIEESYISTIKYKVGKRVSFPFKEVWVSPKFGKYFSMGNRELNPDWTVYFQ